MLQNFRTGILSFRLSGHVIDSIALIYLAIPLLLFVAGWIHPLIAYPLCLAFIYVLALFLHNQNRQESDSFSVRQFINAQTIPVYLGISALLFFAGLSGDYSQHSDWFVRNDIFYDLMNQPWPLVCDDGKYPVYYFASFLPAALIGSFAGWEIAEKFFYCWSLLGMLLIFYYLVRFCGRFSITLLVFWFLWNGAEVLPGFGMGLIRNGVIPEYSSDRMLSPFCDLGTAEIIRSFPHAYIPSALALIMCLFSAFRFPLMFFFASVVVLNNPMGAPFFLVFMIGLLFSDNREDASFRDRIIHHIKKLCSGMNLVSVLITIGCLFPFFTVMGSSGHWGNLRESNEWVIKTVLFILFDVGIVTFFALQYKRNKLLIYLSAGMHILMLGVGVFYSFDFGLKSCSLSHFALFLFFADSYIHAPKKTQCHPLKIGSIWYIVYIILGPLCACFSMYGCLCSVGLVLLTTLFFRLSGKLQVLIVSLSFLALSALLTLPQTASVRQKAIAFWETKTPCLNDQPGIYKNAKGGEGLWWWYRFFPQADSLPFILKH